MPPQPAFWEDPETVARFAGLAPDIHWQKLLDSRGWPAGARSLDLGCAGGRNLAPALAAGLRPIAFDRSTAMLQTAARAGTSRVRGTMLALPFAAQTFELILCTGVFHCASTDAELAHALAEAARVLRPGGLLLGSVFSHAMLPPEAVAVTGQQTCYRVDDETLCRPTPEQFEAALTTAGLPLAQPLDIRPGPPDSGRVTLLALARRAE